VSYSEQADEVPLSNVVAWSCVKQLQQQQQRLQAVLSNARATLPSGKNIENVGEEFFIGSIVNRSCFFLTLVY
jgi:hypothetical protein